MPFATVLECLKGVFDGLTIVLLIVVMNYHTTAFLQKYLTTKELGGVPGEEMLRQMKIAYRFLVRPVVVAIVLVGVVLSHVLTAVK